MVFTHHPDLSFAEYGTFYGGHRTALSATRGRLSLGPRFFVGTSLMSLAVFVSATVLFLAIPRVGLGLFRGYHRRRVQHEGQGHLGDDEGEAPFLGDRLGPVESR